MSMSDRRRLGVTVVAALALAAISIVAGVLLAKHAPASVQRYERSLGPWIVVSLVALQWLVWAISKRHRGKR